MNFINPLGVSPIEGIQPRACMCSTTDGFIIGRGSAAQNTCARCGCHCNAGTVNLNANHNIAVTTNRAS
jgi:putative bacteriocin precursor